MPRFFDFVRNQYTDLPVPPAPANIANGTYIVTGANTGLGFECTKHLFRIGTGRIIMTARSLEKGEAALAAIRRETGRQAIGEVWELDLTSLDSVEAFARRIDTLERLDALIANAGVATARFEIFEGMELSLVVNVVSTMLLAFRALPKLQESARGLAIQPHLVVVSSNAAFASSLERIVEQLPGDVFDGLSTEKGYKTMVQYPMTKQLEVYAVRQLASLLPLSKSGVVINIVSPGLCYSDLDRNASFIPKLALATMKKLLARTSEEGSRNLLQAVFAGLDSHGKFCSECQIRDDMLPTWVTNETGKRTQKRVWDDLLKRLDSLGHSVDMAAFTAR